METPKERAKRLVYGTEKPTALYEALRVGGMAACNDEDLEQIAEELEREFEEMEGHVRFLQHQLDTIREKTGYHVVTMGMISRDT